MAEDASGTEGLPTEHRRYTYGIRQNSRGYGRDYVSIIYTRVDLGSSSCRASGFPSVVWCTVRPFALHAYVSYRKSDRSIHDVTP